MRKLAILICVSGVLGLFAKAGFAEDTFHGEWVASFTNSTATYTNSGIHGSIKKLASVWFHHAVATTATCSVHVVKGTDTNNVLTDPISSVQDVQWTPRKSLWLRLTDKVIVGSNSSTGCTARVQFDK